VSTEPLEEDERGLRTDGEKHPQDPAMTMVFTLARFSLKFHIAQGAPPEEHLIVRQNVSPCCQLTNHCHRLIKKHIA